MVNDAEGPCHERSGLLQSLLATAGCGVKVGKSVGNRIMVGVASGSKVGEGAGVSVGRDVCVGVAVGGRDVFVGMAACVCATTVNAAAIAVF
jgi:hypothetical protein